MHRRGLPGTMVTVLVFISAIGCYASAIPVFDPRDSIEAAEIVAIAKVGKEAKEGHSAKAAVHVIQVLKGDIRAGSEVGIRYPSEFPNEEGIEFSISEGRSYLLFLKRLKEGFLAPAAKHNCSLPVPAGMAERGFESPLEGLQHLAISCLDSDDAAILETAVRITEGLAFRLNDKNAQLTATFDALDQAMRERAQQLYPKASILAYVLRRDLAQGRSEAVLQALLFLRRGEHDPSYRKIAITHFISSRQPESKELMLSLLIGGNASLAAHATNSMWAWADRQCVPFIIELMRTTPEAFAAQNCDRVLFGLAIKEQQVPEAQRLTEKDHLRAKGTYWRDGLRTEEERNARAEYWESWWKPVWRKSIGNRDAKGAQF